MSAPSIRELCQRATPGPWSTEKSGDEHSIVNRFWSGNDWDVATVHSGESNAQLIARLSPDVVLKAVEALTDTHLYIDDGLEGSPAKRKAMLLQIESALDALNATAQPTGEQSHDNSDARGA